MSNKMIPFPYEIKQLSLIFATMIFTVLLKVDLVKAFFNLILLFL